MDHALTSREQLILTAIVEDYIHLAQPVASGRVKQVTQVSLSSATIRHIMANLENSGHLFRPHTSAGKVPTDVGYRTYVDDLMEIERVGRHDVYVIRKQLEKISGDVESLLQLLADLISRLTGSVGIAVWPVSPNARLISIGLVPAEGGRILMVLETDSADLRTVVIQIENEITGAQLAAVEEILRDRLCGLTLEEILATVGVRLGGTLADDYGLAGYILQHAGELLEESRTQQISSHGLHQVLQTPEFLSSENAAGLASLLEDVPRLRTLVINDEAMHAQVVTIGAEHGDEELHMLSVIRQGYYIGENFGTLAVLAPKRVNYRQVCALLEYLGTALSEHWERTL
ncbi:MAG: heat-inducible transcription repressor HrcA [Candidatus Marinimicrobia bacterium]|nr:heat-inducible transcription repressor HrcA [Candidatus Neomarinimicrobiota bacterium]